MKTIIIITCAFLSLIFSMTGLFLLGSYFTDQTKPEITGFVTEQEYIQSQEKSPLFPWFISSFVFLTFITVGFIVVMQKARPDNSLPDSIFLRNKPIQDEKEKRKNSEKESFVEQTVKSLIMPKESKKVDIFEDDPVEYSDLFKQIE